MKRILILTAMLTLVAGTAMAGYDGKCSGSTQECLDGMAHKMQNSGWVGVELEGIENAPGNLVSNVVASSPAAEAGLETGDILLGINGIELADENMDKLKEIWGASAPGQEVVWTIKRGSNEREVNLVLARMPADVLAAHVGRHMLQHTEVASVE